MRLLLALAIAVAVVGASKKVKAHSWYDIECCSHHDCKPTAVDDLSEQPDGSWKHLPTGLIFARDKVKPSKDNKFHVCIRPHDQKPLCVYILQGS
jgi:hypothetical protein